MKNFKEQGRGKQNPRRIMFTLSKGMGIELRLEYFVRAQQQEVRDEWDEAYEVGLLLESLIPKP